MKETLDFIFGKIIDIMLSTIWLNVFLNVIAFPVLYAWYKRKFKYAFAFIVTSLAIFSMILLFIIVFVIKNSSNLLLFGGILFSGYISSTLSFVFIQIKSNARIDSDVSANGKEIFSAVKSFFVIIPIKYIFKFLLVVLVSCAYGLFFYNPVTELTDLNEWISEKFQVAGVVIEVPKDADIKSYVSSEMTIRLHPHEYILADNQYGVIITLEYISSEAFTERIAERLNSLKSSDSYEKLSPEGRRNWEWHYLYHDTIAYNNNNENWIYYRYDKKLKNNNMITCSAELKKYADTPENAVAIKRIFESIQEM
jgi:hypothetical protein